MLVKYSIEQRAMQIFYARIKEYFSGVLSCPVFCVNGIN